MNNITVTDIVDLIIEKNIKPINDSIEEKQKAIRDLKNRFENTTAQKVENLKLFMEEHFDSEGLKYFLEVFGMTVFRDFGMMGFGYGMDSNVFYRNMFLAGLILKDDNNESKEIDILKDEIDSLINSKNKIKQSRSLLITEVTLQQLSSIDADFAEKLDSLAEKIFNIKQIN